MKNMTKKELKGKRLLALGGSSWKNAIKQYTQEQGIVLIAAAPYRVGIFDIADEHYIEDVICIEKMKRFIREHQIDGVYMGGSEPVIKAACQYISELGKPCYCTPEQWNWLQDKRKFKELCIKYGLPVTPKYEITEDNIETYSKTLSYPVIIKPADGCGSNGFSVCHNSKELRPAYQHAVNNSPTGSIICEKFVRNDSVVVFYTFSEGKMFFSGIEDKFPVKYEENQSFVAGMHLFESRFKDEFRLKFDRKLQLAFEDIGIKEGALWIEVFHDEDNYYFNEVGYRYSGSVSIYPVDYFYGINQVASDIYFSLTGESLIRSHTSLIKSGLPRKKYYCIYNVHMRPGIIRSVEGINLVQNHPCCVFLHQNHGIGDNVSSSGSVAQVFAFVHFVYDNVDECKEMVEWIHNTLKVKDEYDNEMILRKLDINEKINHNYYE